MTEQSKPMLSLVDALARDTKPWGEAIVASLELVALHRKMHQTLHKMIASLCREMSRDNNVSESHLDRVCNVSLNTKTDVVHVIEVHPVAHLEALRADKNARVQPYGWIIMPQGGGIHLVGARGEDLGQATNVAHAYRTLRVG